MSTTTSNCEYRRTVLLVDNDECIGAWSLASAIHGLFTTYIPTHTGIPVETCLQIFKKNLIIHYLSNGGARPGTKSTLQLAKTHKDAGNIDHVVMFTSCSNKNGWVVFLKECIEEYAGVSGIYDYVFHRDNTPAETAQNGATVKCLTAARKRLGYSPTDKVIIIDDSPQNVRGTGHRVAVTKYRHIVGKTHIEDLIVSALNDLQAIWTASPGKIAPKRFAPLLVDTVINAKDGYADGVRFNMNRGYAVNQMDDSNLMATVSKAFLELVPTMIPLVRTTSVIPPPVHMKRSISA